jgi:ABC-2 type transport system ATP-binding protein
MTAVLEFLDIARSYKADLPVLDGVTFSVNEGEVVGLLGRNGAGKTTLIRIAMGMLYPHRGSVRVFGMSPTEDPVAVKKRIGYVAEDQTFPAGASVAELLVLHRYLFEEWDTSLEDALLNRFELSPDSKIKHLSKGQARQVAVLCAICHRPELLILDEPAGGLDAVARREFLEASIQLLNREGTTILFSTHQMADVERIGGRVILLDGTKVRLDRNLDALREETCLAFIPIAAAPNASAIRRIPGCFNVRPVSRGWHALMEGTPDEVHEQLEKSFGANGIRCSYLPLEELFIEITRADR